MIQFTISFTFFVNTLFPNIIGSPVEATLPKSPKPPEKKLLRGFYLALMGWLKNPIS